MRLRLTNSEAKIFLSKSGWIDFVPTCNTEMQFSIVGVAPESPLLGILSVTITE